jgi:AraC-like DNA-binding protein
LFVFARQGGNKLAVAQLAMKAILAGLRRLGLPPRVTRVTTDEALHAVWTHAMTQAGRRTVPLEVGLEMPLGEMGVVDYLAAASASVGAAVTVAQQVFPLVAPSVQLLIEARRAERRVSIVNHPPFPGEAESDLLVLGLLLARLRSFASGPLMPEVELRETSGERAWKQRLLVSQVKLGASRTCIVFKAREWATPLRSEDPRLLDLLRQSLGPLQRSLDATLVSVRALARDHLPQLLTLYEAARALGVSERTLQRRLRAAETSLRQLVDEARRERAVALVEQRLWSLGEVAGHVGFAEQASFTRAWGRWFGAPPSRSQGTDPITLASPTPHRATRRKTSPGF